MTDEQISEAIEQHVLGYIIAGPYVADRDGNFVRMLGDPRPNYCGDAMVGWLLRWLAGQGLKPALGWVIDPPHLWRGSFAIAPYVRAEDDAPGRALCLAALQAHGVDVGMGA